MYIFDHKMDGKSYWRIYSIIQDTDYRAMQTGLHWKSEDTHTELMGTFLANYPAHYLHLRALSRITSNW